jgi:hypothetical protein
MREREKERLARTQTYIHVAVKETEKEGKLNLIIRESFRLSKKKGSYHRETRRLNSFRLSYRTCLEVVVVVLFFCSL